MDDWWNLLVTESDEILGELARFLRVPCGNAEHDSRADQGIICIERELLGRLVRREWVKWAKEQPNAKSSWLLSWTELSESEREVDRRIGYACKIFLTTWQSGSG